MCVWWWWGSGVVFDLLGHCFAFVYSCLDHLPLTEVTRYTDRLERPNESRFQTPLYSSTVPHIKRPFGTHKSPTPQTSRWYDCKEVSSLFQRQHSIV